MIDLFDKLLLPILNYCSEVWGFIQANTVERVHLHFLKKLLGVKRVLKMSLPMVNVIVHYYLAIYKRQYFIVKYWFKILQCNESKYVTYIYKIMLAADLDEYPNIINWAYLVKDLLSGIGFTTFG